MVWGDFAIVSLLSRTGFKTCGDCPNFAQSAEQTWEQNGTVPFSEAVFG